MNGNNDMVLENLFLYQEDEPTEDEECYRRSLSQKLREKRELLEEEYRIDGFC